MTLSPVLPASLRRLARLALAAVPFAILSLAGCASSDVGDHATRAIADGLPQWAGGEPTSVPRRPAVQPDFLPVFETPPARSTTPLNADQQKALQSKLMALRNSVEAKAMAARASDPLGKPRIMAADPEHPDRAGRHPAGSDEY